MFDHNVVWKLEQFGRKLDLMQVPPDLAMRLSSAAQRSGRSPQDFLREAICRLIENTPYTLPPAAEADHASFIPQVPRFSIYE